MKASKLIQQLLEAILQEGDLEVAWPDSDSCDQSEIITKIIEINVRHNVDVRIPCTYTNIKLDKVFILT